MARKELTRREALKVMVMGIGAVATGCAGVEETQIPRATEENRTVEPRPTVALPPIITATVIPQPTDRGPNATPVGRETPQADEAPVSPEEVARGMEGLLWTAGTEMEPSVIWATPIRRDRNGKWQVRTDRGVEELHFWGVDLRVADVSWVEGGGGELTFFGYVSGVTGDHRLYQLELARWDGQEWSYTAQPREKYRGATSEAAASYLYIAGESHFYLNKAWNIAQSCRLLMISMMQAPIAANGGEFSLLERIDAKHNFFDRNLYRLGYALRIEDLVPAGGACGFASPLARALVQVTGDVDGVKHLELVYEDLPYGGVEDETDVTVFYSEEAQLDLHWVNTTGEDLWIIPRLSLWPMAGFPQWWSPVSVPSPVRMALSFSISRRPPTQEELEAIERQMEWLAHYEIPPMEVGVRETLGPAFYDGELVDSAYVRTKGEGRLEDIEVDPEIMEIVEGLEIGVNGDITEELMRAIPVDDVIEDEHSLRVHYSEHYFPLWKIVWASSMGVELGDAGDQLLWDETAKVVVEFQRAAHERGMGAYMVSALRDPATQTDIQGAQVVAPALGSEHLTGLAFDVVENPTGRRYPGSDLEAVANQFGLVRSMGGFDPGHYFHLDGVHPGLTRALMERGWNVNDRYTVAHARLAVFKVKLAQAERR